MRVRPMLRRLFLLGAGAALAGCGILPGFGEADDAIEHAHVVFLTRPDCRWVVAKTQGGGFALVAPIRTDALRQGDLLVGDLRTGTLQLRTVPFPGDALTEPVPFQAAGVGLSLARAQADWRRACPGPPPDTPDR